MTQNFVFDSITGLIPAVVQHYQTQQILMLAYMNKESFEQTLQTNKITFFSRSRDTIWVKGETSGNFLDLISWTTDCDRDSLLFQARPHGPTCHLGNTSCFANFVSASTDILSSGVGFSSASDLSSAANLSSALSSTSITSSNKFGFLKDLESTIQQRFLTDSPGKSYVAALAKTGLDKIAQKVGEEAIETVIAAKNENDLEFKNEAADLLFHFLVLLRAKNMSLSHILEILETRKTEATSKIKKK